MIGDSENPLTEVALALSMAFFSLMVLMLFAITNTPNSSNRQALEIQTSAESEAKKESPTYLIFYKGEYFNELLEPTNPAEQDPAKPLLLAVTPELDISSMMNAMQKITHPHPEVIILSQKWQQALNKKGGQSQ